MFVFSLVIGSTIFGLIGISFVAFSIPSSIPSLKFSTSTFPNLTKTTGKPVSWHIGICFSSASLIFFKIASIFNLASSLSSTLRASSSAFFTSFPKTIAAFL